MKRITQTELINRIYTIRKLKWLSNNTEELTTGKVDYTHANVRYQSAETLEFKPFFCIRKFDANVCIRYMIQCDIRAGKRLLEFDQINDFDYFTLRGLKVNLHS